MTCGGAYLPLFAFQRVEYKLFSPMAFALGFSLFGALLVALTLIPGLAYVAYRKPRRVFHNRWLERGRERYRGALRRLVPRTALALTVAAGVFVVILALGFTAGRDFLPYLDEGSLWCQVSLPQGISLDKARDMADELRRATLEFPEVAHTVTQTGRNDDGTDNFTPSHIEYAITLHPYSTWKSGMTKQELKDEHKQAEGDPVIKARLRSLARDRSRRRMIAAASRASLVIANPTHYAIALRYQRNENAAPLVLAKGMDAIALKIRAVAEENRIPVIENKALARALYEAVQVDQVIPSEFFRPVAEIIYFLQSKKSPPADNVQ